MAPGYQDPTARALAMLTGGGGDDVFGYNPDPGTPSGDFSSALLGTNPAGGADFQDGFAANLLGRDPGTGMPNFQDQAPAEVNPFDMSRYHVQPKAVKDIPWWGYLASGLLDAVNLRQQLHPGRTKSQIQYGHGRTRNVYTAREAPASSNALASLMMGHANQKHAAQGQADQYNQALDLMGLKGSMQNALAANEDARKIPKNPLLTTGNTRVSEAGALQYLYPGDEGTRRAREFLDTPAAAKMTAGAASAMGGADYRTARSILKNSGLDPDAPENQDALEAKMKELADMRKNEPTESNANKSAALKNELDQMERQINTFRSRSTALKSRIALQSSLTPQARAKLQADINDADHQAELLTTDWNNKNEELSNLPTKSLSRATGTPRGESPTSDPLSSGAPGPDFSGVQGGGSSTARPAAVAPPSATPKRTVTESDLTPDVVRRIRSNPDWLDRARQQFPNRPEFR